LKLQHLAIGARFEYEGVVYVKTGPLTASSEQGGARIIPRYAILKPVDAPQPGSASPERVGLDSKTVHAAFDSFFETCNRLVDESRREALSKARDEFLTALK
jgi:hypothetical protein